MKESEVTPELSRWASAVLRRSKGRLGYEERQGAVTARVEQHSYFGADPKKASRPHPGVSLFVEETLRPAPTETITLPEVVIYGTVPKAPPRTILAVPGLEENTTSEFRKALCEMCDRLGAHQDHIVTVMSFESAGSFSPSKRNGAGSSGTGLIQFMKDTAIALGTTTERLAKMSAIEQLEYVEKYFKPFKGKLSTLELCYLSVYKPALRGKPDSYVTSQKDVLRAVEYRQNAGLDTNKDGSITVGEICAVIRHVAARAKGRRIAV